MLDEYTVATEKGFEEAVESVLKAIKKKKLRVLHMHDIHSLLAKEEVSIEPLKIIEFCNEDFATKLLQMDMKMSLIMPCKISVYIKEGKTYITTLRPRAIGDYYPELARAAEREDELNISIVEKAKD